MRQVITIPVRLPGLNDLMRLRGTKGAPWAYTAEKARLQALMGPFLRGRSKHKGCVALSFFWVERDRRRDPDNVCAAGRKIVLDALVAEGIIAGDGWKTIASWTDRWSERWPDPVEEVRRFRLADRGDCGVVVAIEDIAR